MRALAWAGPLVVLLLGLAAPARAQVISPDTAVVPQEAPSLPAPRAALWRAAVLPGWGQYYNGQYYKSPFVYAGLGALTAAAVYYTRRHRRWDRAFLYIRSEELVAAGTLDENTYLAFRDEYRELVTEVFGGVEVSASTIRPTRDNLRRNRDLFYVGIGLGYALSVLDAYVSAHLLDFDVSEDLGVTLQPHPRGLRATLRWNPD